MICTAKQLKCPIICSFIQSLTNNSYGEIFHIFLLIFAKKPFIFKVQVSWEGPKNLKKISQFIVRRFKKSWKISLNYFCLPEISEFYPPILKTRFLNTKISFYAKVRILSIYKYLPLPRWNCTTFDIKKIFKSMHRQTIKKSFVPEHVHKNILARWKNFLIQSLYQAVASTNVIRNIWKV